MAVDGSLSVLASAKEKASGIGMNDASNGGNDARSPICAVVAFSRIANAEK